MFINSTIERIQNSKFTALLSNSWIFENIDDISFVLMGLTIISTSFATSDVIGFFAVLFVISSLFKIFTKKGEHAELSIINKILVLYLLFVIISLMGASYFMLSLKGIMKTFIYFSFYFSAVYYLSSNKKKIIPILTLIAFATTAEAIVGLFQNAYHIEPIATWQDTSNLADPNHAISRAYGTLQPYNPNLLAGYLVAGLSSISALFSIAFLQKEKRALIIYSSAFMFTCAGILVTGSRGAYLGLFGFIAVLLVFGISYAREKFGSLSAISLRCKLYIAGILTSIMIFLAMSPAFMERIKSIFAFRKDSSISFRMNVYEACWEMFKDNLLIGIGVGNKNFREIYGLYMKTGYDALGSYCVPLEVAVESGIFALILFTSFIIILIIRCKKYLEFKGAHIINKIIIASILLCIIAVMAHGLFDTIFFRPQVQIIFWTNIAMFHAITIKRERLKRLRLLK